MSLLPLRSLISPNPPRDRLVIDGCEVPVSYRRNGRAKRIILRMDRKSDGVILTVPPGVSFKKALDFAVKQSAWIKKHLQKRIDKVTFADGALVPLRGELHRIEHRPDKRGTVWVETPNDPDQMPMICVAGDAAHLPRRARDWLKKQAREDLSSACSRYSGAMGLTHKRISIRDTSSRWGSCSSSGNLSFSWRLILAPVDVLDYVAAHEMAHLKEMNHGPDFWALVEAHCTHTKSAKAWLKKNGPDLHRYGD